MTASLPGAIFGFHEMAFLICASLLVVLLTVFFQETSGWHEGKPHMPTYKLTHPIRVAVDSDAGMLTSYLYPGQRLRLEDPNNHHICHQFLRDDYTAFVVPPTQQEAFKKKMTYSLRGRANPYSNQLVRYLSDLGSEGKPWVMFLRTKNIFLPPSTFQRIHLRSSESAAPWQLDALTMSSAEEDVEEEDDDFSEDVLAAPTPFYQSLCVGPEYPKPFPVLYSFPPGSTLRPGLGSFSIADLTPAVINRA